MSPCSTGMRSTSACGRDHRPVLGRLETAFGLDWLVPVPVSWTQAAHDHAASSSSARRASVGVRYP